jgi:hypothetical protein
MRITTVILALGMPALSLAAQAPSRQTESDAYTRYELMGPGTSKFRIIYEVTVTSAGTMLYYNPVRLGSIPTAVNVIDRASGDPLDYDIVGSDIARAAGIRAGDTAQKYIQVTLTKPVPADGGEARVLILKTYEDPTSYYMRGDTLVFSRPLGIKRNAVVLPRGYELLSSTFPAQVLQENDGRIGISFWNATPSEAAVTMRALPIRDTPTTRSSVANRLDERARQNREIVYSLREPATGAFDLYHDYTESRPGTSTYLNIVRAGSTVSNPRARNLDTGEELKWEIVRGDAITAAKLDVQNVTPQTEVVVFRFPPVVAGGSVRLRMFETYTDTARYKLVGDELVWDRAFGRPTNAVVLPAGWMLTNSSIPATVTTQPDGRVRLDFVNPRPDEISVLITARRRVR